MALESEFQRLLIEEIMRQYPGAIVLKNDPNYIQGIPDWSVFYKNNWAMLEMKKDINSKCQPNQPYYVDLFNRMSYASFVYPQNKDQVLYELQYAFRPRRSARVPQR